MKDPGFEERKESRQTETCSGGHDIPIPQTQALHHTDRQPGHHNRRIATKIHGVSGSKEAQWRHVVVMRGISGRLRQI